MMKPRCLATPHVVCACAICGSTADGPRHLDPDLPAIAQRITCAGCCPRCGAKGLTPCQPADNSVEWKEESK